MAEGLQASLISTDGISSRGRRCFQSSVAHHTSIHSHSINSYIVESQQAVVAADDGRCSEIGVMMLEKGGHAVDAAIATAICLGVVSPMSSGIGGGAFMLVKSSSSPFALAIDMRETAPAAASQNMYDENTGAKSEGALSIGVPGE
ncbi:Gamma-glutamyltranspeptidase 3, variant 2 [Salvia divinorum]|uniref:Gamma-glutamyltranspeptidase 3, variant 2 n=1 Tax=Salvia divinorum TaxID=28513 RepID=A0ABD1I624_SALDI